MDIDVKMTVNGKTVSGKVEARTLLVQFIREHLRLTGTHVGCDTTQCGCCVVHVDGVAMKSCTMLAVQAEGKAITTIEGLAQADGSLSILQEAFRQNHGLQCGFCTPGMLITLTEHLRDNPDPTEAELREVLTGNLCRCTGYQAIVEAGLDAAAKMRASKAEHA